MPNRSKKTILFLCTGNYYRSRFAEILFNSVAGKMGLPWRASSRGLALERGVNNVGPMAAAAIKALENMGLRAVEGTARSPAQARRHDFENADFIVALKQVEHLPLLQERFSAWVEKVEFWHVDDAVEALALIEREVMGLTARLIGGGNRQEVPTPDVDTQRVGVKKSTEVAKTNAIEQMAKGFVASFREGRPFEHGYSPLLASALHVFCADVRMRGQFN